MSSGEILLSALVKAWPVYVSICLFIIAPHVVYWYITGRSDAKKRKRRRRIRRGV